MGENEPLRAQRFQQPDAWRWGTFTNKDRARLRYGHAEPPVPSNGVVVMLPGWPDAAENLFEAVRDFQNGGYAVWVLEWRGQGGSDRWLPNHQKAYSEGLDRDERDLVQFVEEVVVNPTGAPVFLVGESFGAHIGLRALHDHRNLIRAAAFAAPAIAFHTAPYPRWFARALTRVAMAFGAGDSYAIGQKDWTYKANVGGPDDPASSDPIRGLLLQETFLLHPELRVGGATYGFVDHNYASGDLLQSKGWMAAIEAPVLMGVPPLDRIADADVMDASCRAMPHCTQLDFPGARHSLPHEADPHRARWIGAAVDFLGRNRRPSSIQ